MKNFKKKEMYSELIEKFHYVCIADPNCRNILFYADCVEEFGENNLLRHYYVGYEKTALGSIDTQDFDRLVCKRCGKCVGVFSFEERHQQRMDGSNPVLLFKSGDVLPMVAVSVHIFLVYK